MISSATAALFMKPPTFPIQCRLKGFALRCRFWNMARKCH